MPLMRAHLRSCVAWIRALVGIVVSAITEKNPAKVLASTTPVVLSATRIIIVAFAIAMLRQIWKAGIAGWPEAWVTIACMLALPLIAALEALGPKVTIEVFEKLLDRFGTGAARTITSVYDPREPSLHDDHRDDTQ